MEAQWYYARNGTERHGPFPESEIRALLAQGQINPDDLMWREGMASWTPLRAITEFQSPTPEVNAAPVVRVPVPAGLCGWMAFDGIVSILSGVAYVMLCFALPNGILLIIAGAALMSAQSMLAGVHEVDPALLPFLQKLRTFFLMTGIATVVAIVLSALFFIIGIGLGAASMASLLEQITSH